MTGCSSAIPQKSITPTASSVGRAPAPGRRRTGARSRERVGTTQPKQAPNPQAMPDSSASWAGTPRSAHSARTPSSIGGGPQA